MYTVFYMYSHEYNGVVFTSFVADDVVIPRFWKVNEINFNFIYSFASQLHWVSSLLFFWRIYNMRGVKFMFLIFDIPAQGPWLAYKMLNKVCFVAKTKVYENGKMTKWICVQSASQEPILISRQECIYKPSWVLQHWDKKLDTS